jgi:hypothetical protein
MPLLWGDFKVVKSAFRRMHLIKDVLSNNCRTDFVCVMLFESKQKHYVWGIQDMTFI